MLESLFGTFIQMHTVKIEREGVGELKLLVVLEQVLGLRCRYDASHCEPLFDLNNRLVVRVGRQLKRDLLGDEGVGARMDWAVKEPRVEVGLRLACEANAINSHASLRLGAPLSTDQVLVLRNRSVPNQLDRNALLLELACSRVPDRHHVDLAVADEMRGPKAAATPALCKNFLRVR